MLHQLPDPPTLPLNGGGNPLRAFHQLSEKRQETGQCCPPLPMLPPPPASLPLGNISLLNLVLSCVYVRGPTGVSEDIPALESSGSIWSILNFIQTDERYKDFFFLIFLTDYKLYGEHRIQQCVSPSLNTFRLLVPVRRHKSLKAAHTYIV